VQKIYCKDDIKKSTSKIINLLTTYASQSRPAAGLRQLQNLKFNNSCDQKIFELILSHILQAENLTAGGFDGFVFALNEEKLNINSIENLSQHNLMQLLSTFVDKDMVNLIVDCLNLTGLHGKIILSQHPVNGDRNIAELNTGCFFNELFPAFEIKATKFLNPKIICIDGFIETVAEIHRILEDASKSKETIILFIRGLSDEVRHTLKVNYDRGSLQMIPVIIKYDLEGVNLLNDIAITNNSDVISSNKGQLINNIDINNFSRVESVDITSAGVLIENQSTRRTIDMHVKKLQEKMIDSINQYEKDLLQKRIQNLGMHRITIRLQDCQDKQTRSLEIDRALRAIKNAHTHGVCEYKNKLYPYAGIKAGIFYANKFLVLTNELNCIIAD